MANKVNEELPVIYQAPNAETGATIDYTVYDEAYAAFASGQMSEIGSTGRYYATFTPDAVGVWVVTVQKDDGTGKTTARYDVKTKDEEDTIAVTDILSDSTAFAGANIDQSLSDTESNIRGADSDTLETLSDQLDSVSTPAKAM